MSNEVFIIIPCFNEDQTIIKLIREIEVVVKDLEDRFTIVIVDDNSTDNTLSQLMSFKPEGKMTLKVLSLNFNMGHQGAIAQGLLFANENKADYAIVMDGDGEDDPMAIPELLKLRHHDIVMVKRGKREGKWRFKIAYRVYRIVFRLLTNKKMDFGNYCMINARVIETLSSRTYIHFAAFLSKQQFKTEHVVFDRRNRIGGNPKMKMNDLIHHAFRSFAEYGDALLMVFLKLFVVLFIFFILTIGYIAYLKIFTDRAILGWSSTFGIGLLTSALLCMGFFVTGVLLLNISESRSNQRPVSFYKIVR